MYEGQLIPRLMTFETQYVSLGFPSFDTLLVPDVPGFIRRAGGESASPKIRFEVARHASFGDMDNIAREYASPPIASRSQVNVSLGGVDNIGGKAASNTNLYIVRLMELSMESTTQMVCWLLPLLEVWRLNGTFR
jgi:hypothetical protein